MRAAAVTLLLAACLAVGAAQDRCVPRAGRAAPGPPVARGPAVGWTPRRGGYCAARPAPMAPSRGAPAWGGAARAAGC
jgi:hypothetical protein